MDLCDQEDPPVESTAGDSTAPILAAASLCPALVDDNPDDWAILRQGCVPEHSLLDLPPWLKKRMTERVPRERLGKPVFPLQDPARAGQLIYPAEVDTKPAKMLLDPGASHCFMDWQWAQDNNIPIRACPETSINLFQGTALGAIKWTYLANHFVMGENFVRLEILGHQACPC